MKKPNQLIQFHRNLAMLKKAFMGTTAKAIAVVLAPLAISAPAHALTYTFSFFNNAGGPVNGGTVTGTISGLADNASNQTTGLNLAITSSPNTPAGGWNNNWTYSSGSGFTVLNGVVTVPSTTSGFTQFGNASSCTLAFGPSTSANCPGFANTSGNVAIFTPVSAPASAPAPLPLLGAGTAFGFSRQLRKRMAKGGGK